MKFLNFLLAAILLVSCESTDPMLTNDQGELFSLNASISSQEDEIVHVAGSNANTVFAIPVKVVSIEDSRCPMDAICVWEGEAKVAFKASNFQFTVSIGGSHQFEIGSAKYKLTLTDVTPYPSSTNQNERKKAVYTLEKL